MPVDVDWEVEFNGLILNDYATTPPSYPIDSIDGLDTPDIRVEEIDRVLEHGAFTFGRFYKPRRVILQGEFFATTPTLMETAHDALKTAFAAQAADLALRFQRPGSPAIKRLYCKPSRGPAVVIDPQYAIGNGKYLIELLAGDPRIYDDTQSSQAFTANQSISLTNAGNIGTWPTVTFNVTGTIGALEVKNVATGERLVLAGSYVNTDVVVIDFANRKITKNGVSNYADLNQTLSTWWDLNPGAQNVQVVGASGYTATVVWRSAWL